MYNSPLIALVWKTTTNREIVPLLWSLSRKDSSLSSLLSPSTLTSVLLEISVQQNQTEAGLTAA